VAGKTFSCPAVGEINIIGYKINIDNPENRLHPNNNNRGRRVTADGDSRRIYERALNIIITVMFFCRRDNVYK